MARIFIDGFESGNLGFWTQVGTNPVLIDSSVTGRQGSYCANSQANSSMSLVLPTAKSSIYAALKVSVTSNSLGANSIIAFYNGTTQLGSVNTPTDLNTLRAFRPTSVLLGESTFSWSFSTWFLLEVYYLPHVSNGTFIVKANGVTEINLTGIQTAPSTSDITKIIIGGGSPFLGFYVDDVILDDANWIGNTTVQAMALSGGGSTTQWDPSSGSNYACVDEVPGSDADYVSTNVSGEIDTYQCADLTGVINSVKSVQVQARAMKEGLSGPTQLYLVARPGSTDRLSPVRTVGTFTPKSQFGMWQTNPDTSNPWVSGEVNSLEIGIKAVG